MDSSYISSKHLTKKPKNLEFFWFFALLQLRLPWVFLVFKNLNQKKQKKLKENQKKHLLTWNQNFSKKFWFFGFLEVSSHSLFLNQKEKIETEKFY